MRTRLLALPLGLLLLTGCASDPQAEVRAGVRDVLAAANDEDADAVRTTVDDLLSTLREQVGSQELTEAQAQPVRDAAIAVREGVAELEVEETPTPTPTPEETESPTPSPTPTPEPTEEPTPEPTEEPEETEPPETSEPEETQEPEQTQAPDGDGEDGGDDGEDQATVVPQLPVLTSTPGPTPTA